MFIRSRGLPRRRVPQQLQVLCLAKLHRQPGTRQSPVAHDRLRRHSKGLRCFFDAQPSKKPKLDDLGATRVLLCGHVQGIVKGAHLACSIGPSWWRGASISSRRSRRVDNANRIVARVRTTGCIARSTATYYANVNSFSRTRYWRRTGRPSSRRRPRLQA